VLAEWFECCRYVDGQSGVAITRFPLAARDVLTSGCNENSKLGYPEREARFAYGATGTVLPLVLFRGLEATQTAVEVLLITRQVIDIAKIGGYAIVPIEQAADIYQSR
jgi:hypothetical protein